MRSASTVYEVSADADAATAHPADREAAWRALYDEHFPWVYRLVCRFGVPHGDAEDVTQQVFLTAYRRMGETGEIGNLAGWLRGITVRVASGHHRWRRVRRVKRWLVEATFGDDSRAQPTPERRAVVAETRAQVAEVLSALSPKLRSVLVLADVEGLSVSEVAAALAIPVNTVRSRRRLARAAFERLWTATHGEDSP